MSPVEILRFLLPQVILVVTGLALVISDLAIRDDKKKGWLPYLALGGLLLAVILAVAAWGTDTSILGGMLRIDPFSILFDVIVLGATAMVVLASMSYVEARIPHRAEFYALLVFVGLAMSLAVGAGNLIMVYVAMESLSITSYILVGFLRDDKKSSEAGIKYFLYGAVSSAVMLYGMSLLYGMAGTTDLGGIAGFFTAQMPEGARWVAFPAAILMLVGFGFKTALVPFHQWSPDTYEGAPTPITAFLSVASKAAGFAILMRVFLTALPAFRADWGALLAGIAMVTMTIGNLIALKQTNIKRLLAYSSIAHAGYILIGLVAITPNSASAFNGLNGVLIYLLAYMFTNLGVFMTVIAFEESTGSNSLADYAGLIKRSPWLAATMFVFLLSLSGIPATGGFIGKFFVFGAAIQGQLYLLAVVGIINSAIAVFYYLNIVRYMFFVPPAQQQATAVAVPSGIRWVLGISLAMTLLIGLYPQPFVQITTASSALLAAL